MFKKSLLLIVFTSFFGINNYAQCPSAGVHAGPDITICTGNDATLQGTLPNGFTGSWARIGGFVWPTPVITNNTSTNATVSNLGTGTFSYVWTITDGGSCTNIKDTMRIVVQNGATSANGGANKTVCLGDAVTMNATAAPGGSTGIWAYVDGVNQGTVSITDVNNRQTSITGLDNPGTDRFVWSVSSPCGAFFTDTVSINSGLPPAPAFAGADITICVGDTATLYGSVPTSGTPTWTRQNVTIGNTNNLRFVPNANNDTVKIAANTAGTYTLFYTIAVGTPNLASACTTQDTLVVKVNPKLTVNAGTDQISCDGSQTTFTVTGNKPAVGYGEWAITGTSTGFVSTTDTSIGTVSGLSPGVTTLAWQVTDGVCTAVDYMTIAVGPPPVAEAGIDVTGCVNDTVQLIGSNPGKGVGYWTRGAGVTINDFAFAPTANNDTIKIVLRRAGSYKIYYSIALGANAPANTCYSRDSLTINISAAPTTANISGASTINVCSSSSTFTLTGNAPAGGETGTWSIESGSGTFTNTTSATTALIGLKQGKTIAVWTISNGGGCSSSDKVTINVGADAGPDLVACENDTAFVITGNNPTGWTKLWQLQSSSIATIKGAANSNKVTLSITGTGTITMLYTLIDNSTSCVSTDTVVINALPQGACSLGVNEEQNPDPELVIYPNPSSDLFNVMLYDYTVDNAYVELVGVDGRTILSKNLGVLKDVQMQIDLSENNPGMYFLKVRKGGLVMYSKLILE